MSGRVRALFTPEFIRVWWVSAAAMTGGFLLFPTAPFRLRELGAPAAATGWFLGGLTYGSAASAAWTGALADVLGRRRVLLGAGTLLAALAIVYAFVADWRVLVGLSLAHGVAWSSLLVAANSELVRVVPPARRAEGFAYFALAANLAVAVAPAIGLWILEQSWRALTFGIAALDLGVALLAVRLSRDGPIPHDIAHRLAPHRAIDWRTLRVGFALLLASFGYGGLTSFAALFAESRGIAPKGVFFIAFAVTIIAVRPFLAPAMDRRGPRKALPAAFLLATLGLAATALPRTRWEMVGAAVVFGSGFALLGPAFSAWTFDNVSPARQGAAYGAILAAFDLGIGTGSIVLGWVAAQRGYPAAFLTASVLALFAWPYLLWAERASGFERRRGGTAF
jgi:MFS family permease